MLAQIILVDLCAGGREGLRFAHGHLDGVVVRTCLIFCELNAMINVFPKTYGKDEKIFPFPTWQETFFRLAETADEVLQSRIRDALDGR